MTYLSRRCREEREKPSTPQNSLQQLVDALNAEPNQFLPRPMVMSDPVMAAMREHAFEQYEQTLRARNPFLRHHYND